MKNQNPYLKCCPHCQKEFHARRLNQKYCSYFCKVQFNNERARLRRLELLSIANKIQAKRSEKISPPAVVQETIPISNSPNAVEKKITNDTTFWRNGLVKQVSNIPKWVYFLFGLALSGIFYLFYNRRKVSASIIATNFTGTTPKIPTSFYSIK